MEENCHDIVQRHEICDQNRFIFQSAAHNNHLNLDTACLYYHGPQKADYTDLVSCILGHLTQNTPMTPQNCSLLGSTADSVTQSGLHLPVRYTNAHIRD